MNEDRTREVPGKVPVLLVIALANFTMTFTASSITAGPGANFKIVRNSLDKYGCACHSFVCLSDLSTIRRITEVHHHD